MSQKPHDSNSRDVDDARLTAYALGQLDPADRASVERWLAEIGGVRGDQIRRTIDETRLVTAGLIEAGRGDPGPPPSPTLRAAVERRLQEVEEMESQEEIKPASFAEPRPNRRRWLALAAAACLLAVTVPAAFWMAGRGSLAPHDEVAYQQGDAPVLKSQAAASGPVPAEVPADVVVDGQKRDELPFEDPDSVLSREAPARQRAPGAAGPEAAAKLKEIEAIESRVDKGQMLAGRSEGVKQSLLSAYGGRGGSGYAPTKPAAPPEIDAYRGARQHSSQAVQGGTYSDVPPTPESHLGTRVYPVDELSVQGLPAAKERMRAPEAERREKQAAPANAPALNESLARQGQAGAAGKVPIAAKSQAGVTVGVSTPNTFSADLDIPFKQNSFGLAVPQYGGHDASTEAQPEAGQLGIANPYERDLKLDGQGDYYNGRTGLSQQAPGTEQYAPVVENPFLSAADEPLSTFSIDVDTASYANVRRFLVGGRLPPPGAVRIEEMVNYFPYDYLEPEGEHPFSVNMEVAQCPWNGDHRLVRIGLKGREIDRRERGPSNLVFLLDVSGSMSDQNKLPLVKEAMRMLVDQLGEDDRVAIVTYAGSAGLALESTHGENKKKILRAIEALHAGGSTHGSAGIQMAYEQATEHFLPDGTNRVILATDGDLNVGITDDDQLVKLITQKAGHHPQDGRGVFLTVLGFGTGNLKDAKLEKLADHGNGSYAYIDSLHEAYKVLVQQATGSLITIAKDVKIQVEFNPAQVRSYRLVGYENRLLAAEDFANDKKDAGEIGAGHTVTALYEVVPAREAGRGGKSEIGKSKSERIAKTPNAQKPTAVQGPVPPDAAGGLEASTPNSQPSTLNPHPLKYQRQVRPVLTEAARSGELLTLRLRYKEPQGATSELIETTLKDSGKRFGEASGDFRFAAAVASFGLVLRGSLVDGDGHGLGLAAVQEFAAGALGKDNDGYRQEFVDLVRGAEAVYAAASPAGPGMSAPPASYAPAQAAQPAEPAPSAEPQPSSHR